MKTGINISTCVTNPALCIVISVLLAQARPAIINHHTSYDNYDYNFQSGSNHSTILKKFLKDTKEVTDWHSLGIQLEIPTSHLRHIEDNYGSNAKRCKMEVVDYWLQNDPEPARSKLAQAVEDMGGHANVVQTLRARYEGL